MSKFIPFREFVAPLPISLVKNGEKTTYNVEIHEVLLATLDQNNQLQISLK